MLPETLLRGQIKTIEATNPSLQEASWRHDLSIRDVF